MKKIISSMFLLVSLIGAGLISCSACVKQPQVNPNNEASVDASTDTFVDPTMMVSLDNCTLILPTSDWQTVSDGSSPAHSVAYNNTELHNLILLMKEPFSGNNQDYSLFSIRGMKEGGAVLVGSSPTVINNNNYIMTEYSRDNATVKIFSWLMVKDGSAYSFICGGYDATGNSQRNICVGIANTLKIN